MKYVLDVIVPLCVSVLISVQFIMLWRRIGNLCRITRKFDNIKMADLLYIVSNRFMVYGIF